jgi:hypothetical protein
LVKELSTPDLNKMPNQKKPKVYITRRLPDAVETRMRELFDAELNINDDPRTSPNWLRPCDPPMFWCPPSPTESTRR